MLITFQMMIEINIRHTPPGTEYEKLKLIICQRVCVSKQQMGQVSQFIFHHNVIQTNVADNVNLWLEKNDRSKKSIGKNLQSC